MLTEAPRPPAQPPLEQPARFPWTGRRARAVLGVLLALLLVECIFYHEVVFQGRTFLPLGVGYGGVMGSAGPWNAPANPRPDPYRWDRGASSWQIEPWARAVGASLASGQLPLWNPHQGFGAPLLANAQSGGLDVLRLPVFISGSALAWDGYYLLRALLGLLLGFAFGRRLGLGRLGAATAAVAYVFCGFMQILGNNHYVEVYLLLPLVLGGEVLLAEVRHRAGLLALAAGIALSVYAGMPECAILTFSYAALLGLFLVGRAVAHRRWRSAGLLTAWLLAGGTIGLALSGPLLLSLQEYAANASSIHASPNLGLGMQPLFTLAYVGMPFLRGLPGQGVAGLPAPAVKSFSGAAVLLLAVVGTLATPRSRRPEVGFLAAMALFWEAKVLGVPLVNDVGHLPGLNVTLILDWAQPLVAFSLAMLAGFGVDAAWHRRVRFWHFAAAGLLVLVYGAASLALNQVVLATAPLDHLRDTLGLATLAAALAILCLTAGMRWPRLAAAGCAAVVCFELLLLGPHDVYQDRADPLAVPPFVTFLQAQQVANGPGRVFATDGLLHPDLATAFGLDDVRALDALYPSRYLDYVNATLASVSDRYLGQPNPGVEGQTKLAANPWLNLANVRYVVTPPDSPLVQQLAPQFVPVYTAEVAVLANQSAVPRAFFTPAIRGVRNEARALEVIKDPSFDPLATGLVEGSLPDGVSGQPRLVDDPGSVTITRDDPERIEIRVTTPAQRLLVLSDVYDPGWQVTVDGAETPIYATDVAFRGVIIEPGIHRVVFTYAPESVRNGLIAAGLGLLGLVLSLVLLARRRGGLVSLTQP